MPKAAPAKKKVATPIPPKPPEPVAAETVQVTPPVGLPVVYDKLEIIEYSSSSKKGPMTVENMKLILGWETESEYKKRKCQEVPGSKPEQWNFGEGVEVEGVGIQPVHCVNLAGEKVICWNNANNRPFDKDWAESFIHTILYGQWAGPFTIPGETVNGETMRISKYGRVLSGQHQGTGLILAGEWLAKARQNGTDHPNNPKYPVWKSHGEPFIETIVVRGMSEDPKVLMTVDYVKPRSAADVFYTSDLFRNSTSVERKDLCKNLAQAVDLLWTRTDTRGYKTHPEIVGFLERHKRLLKCVEHISKENSTKNKRRIANLRLSPGQCAAIMYLQGSSGPGTDGDIYRNEEPPSEKNLDWTLWEKAENFWSMLAREKEFDPVRIALGNLIDSTPSNETNQGLGGRGPEKMAILAKAWDRWKEHDGKGDVFDDDDLADGGLLSLSYSDLDDKGHKLPDGQIELIDTADFGGIDCPYSSTSKTRKNAEPEPPAPDRETIERLAEEARARREKNK